MLLHPSYLWAEHCFLKRSSRNSQVVRVLSRKGTIWLSCMSLLKSQHQDEVTARSRFPIPLKWWHACMEEVTLQFLLRWLEVRVFCKFRSPVKAQLLNNPCISQSFSWRITLSNKTRKKDYSCQTISSPLYIYACVYARTQTTILFIFVGERSG